jgi:parvulin-like peptidyl-prolyl isomerase
MAKSRAQAQVARPQARHRRRPADTEHLTQLFIVGGVIAVLVIVAAIIGIGYYQTQLKPLGKTVLQVGSIKYSLGHLERRMKVLRQSTSYYDPGVGAPLLADDTMNQLEREARMLQGASEKNISISDEEFATEIKNRGNIADDAKPDVYAKSYAQQIKDSGLHKSEFEMMVRASLLRTKLLDYFRFVTPAVQPQVKANYLVADTQEKADAALTRIRAGEDFKTVADAVVGPNTNGNYDWTPSGGPSFLPKEVEDFLFNTGQVGQTSDAISIGSSYYVVQLLDKDPARALDDTGRQRAGQRDFDAWVDGLKLVVTKHLSDSDKSKALNYVY